jgi:hypothetical protein
MLDVMKEYVPDILISIFIATFALLPLPFLQIFYSRFSTPLIYTIPFLVGLVISYISNKKEESGSLKKTLVVGAIASIFSFIFLNAFAVNFNGYIVEINKGVGNLQFSIQLQSGKIFSMPFRTLEYQQITSMSIMSAILIFVGALVYPLLLKILGERISTNTFWGSQTSF